MEKEKEKDQPSKILRRPPQKKKKAQPDLPEFPEEGTIEKEDHFIPGTELEISEELIEICKDIISVPFEVWSILKPSVTPLSEAEKNLISKPLARIVVKYDVAKFMKDELLLAAFLGFSVLKRIKAKKNVDNDHREERKGENDPSQGANKL